jgi:RNA polymerase sigma-70 factor (ECF subfamily)
MKAFHAYHSDIPFMARRAVGISRAGRDDASEHNAAMRAKTMASDDAVSDRALVEAYFEGDESVFAALVERHLSMTYKFTYRYLQNVDDTNDVVQEVFLKAWKNLARFDVERNFRTWLLTIAKNTALDFIKKKRPVLFSKIEEAYDDLDAFLAPYLAPGAGDLPNEALEKQETKEHLEKMLAGLAPSSRTILSLRYVDRMKFREIAELLGEPIDTVKSKHRRALRALHGDLAAVRDEFLF